MLLVILKEKNVIKLSLSLTIICLEIYAAFHYRKQKERKIRFNPL